MEKSENINIEAKINKKAFVSSIILSTISALSSLIGILISCSIIKEMSPETGSEAIGLVFMFLILLIPTIITIILSLILTIINMVILLKKIKEMSKGNTIYSIISIAVTFLLVIAQIVLLLIIAYGNEGSSQDLTTTVNTILSIF